ncbi:uncharacterized protein LOC123524120 [Mercenaria mercenaria]|uniref:uncharacterized protein LOC123524120 n=1 Tax=Mercenaria mercenaria TaxID=6596 RepID=UPI001E1D558A|nr:uncharacterized protein LOC123524120 [Mercenaria mercenaria]
MADGEPEQKKRKTDVEQDFDPIFCSFLTKRNKVDALDQALIALKRGIWDCQLNLASLHIDDCNARSFVCFSRATLTTTPIQWEDDESPAQGIAFGEIFGTGIDVLEKYLDKSPKIPEDEKMRHALQKLLEFLVKKDYQPLFENQERESDWSVVVAQHLLSVLTVDSTYTVSAAPFTQAGLPPKCPCQLKDDLIGKVGDTSFGCRKGWHGHTDIIMEEDIAVSVAPSEASGDSTVEQTLDDTGTDVSDDRSVSSVENKASPDFKRKDLMQIKAETIVFSFLQHKLKKGILENTLIPSIGISSRSLLLTFYDSQNDVLLSSKAIRLFDQNTIIVSPVVALWLTLNYKLFCTGVTKRMTKYKADFFKRVDDLLNEYSDHVEKPSPVQRNTQDDLFPWLGLTRGYEFPKRRIPFVFLKPDR